MRSFCLLFLCSIVVLAGCKKDNGSACRTPPVAPDKYIYPVKAGSAAWNAAGTWGMGQFDPLDSIYKLCQIPADKLQTMSTAGLVESLKDNPCLFNMLLSFDKFQGRNEVLAKLNVSWALNGRRDAGTTIMYTYQHQEPGCALYLSTEEQKGTFAINWYLFDMVCTQDSILNQLDRGTKKKFAAIVIEKYMAQLKYPDVFGSSKISSILVLSQIMIRENYQPYLAALQNNSDLQVFALTGIVSGDFFNQILDFAIGFSSS